MNIHEQCRGLSVDLWMFYILEEEAKSYYKVNLVTLDLKVKEPTLDNNGRIFEILFDF